LNTGREGDRRKGARGPRDFHEGLHTLPKTPVRAADRRPCAPCVRITPEAARCQVEGLKAEAAKGEQADDAIIANIVNGLPGLVPKALGAILSLFATPIPSGIARPVTKIVLHKFKGS
jgi:hypothetical protein